ncbi:ribosomal RNA large subunit methyltransferase E isoform X2 [Tripterygium wilfordii]|uniref:ribosomal RNA large subunit methyltransferase E isoform X2 n=1 Tax=Tripterygium wilfordii TaxID=458696 RepID=UPI0018F83D60|nr:ribosomal RNA large subunit methyltransferase E isoform X2 [Tripterygium wilfordii]
MRIKLTNTRREALGLNLGLLGVVLRWVLETGMRGGGAPDFFYREAQRLGYVARSAFKLLQIQNKYKLITPGSSVLDLGCAPGAWLQVACQSLGPLKNGGAVVGIDLKNVKVPSPYCDSRVQTVCADVMKLPRQQVRDLSTQKGFSVILSDMCPLVSGITTKDAALSMELGMRALNLAVGGAAAAQPDDDIQGDNQIDVMGSDMDDTGVLRPGGHLVIKLLESEDVQELTSICKPLFRKTSLLRPKATRSSSREIYLICQGLH